MSDNVVLYNNGEIEINISVDENTIWLTQKDITKIFDKDQSVISRHINNIFKDKEVDEKSNMQKMHIASSDKPISLYSLDIILAVGYRTNSAKAIHFRQWATSVLKKYITNGYTINSDKITNDRFVSLEKKVHLLSSKLNILESKELKPDDGIFYNGQIFDAYTFIADIIRSANKSIILIDNYVNDTTLTLFAKVPNIRVTIYTYTISTELKQDFKKYNNQYQNITLKTFKDSHDRFLILDDKEVYLIGASLKDLGKKWFGFSRLEISVIDGMLKKL